MRLIDADDIVYESIDGSDTTRHEYYYGTGIIAVRKEDIDAMPTIEQSECKRGKWITEIKHYSDEDQDFYYEHTCCSICGTKKRIGWYDAKYCPRCGARMDGETDE